MMEMGRVLKRLDNSRNGEDNVAYRSNVEYQ